MPNEEDAMSIAASFERMLESKTRDWFHDASVNEISISTIQRSVALVIEHMRASGKTNIENVIRSTIQFRDVRDFFLENRVETFVLEDEISDIVFSDLPATDTASARRAKVEIIAITGWVISLTFSSFDYKEEQIAIYVYRDGKCEYREVEH